MSRCCPNGIEILERFPGTGARRIAQGDHRAAELGDGAHVHIWAPTDDVIVVRERVPAAQQ